MDVGAILESLSHFPTKDMSVSPNNMELCKNMRLNILLILSLLVIPNFVLGAETGHYVHGVEGLKAATVPPPGIYYRNYTVYYRADKLTGATGDSLPVDFDVENWASVHRMTWISEHKFLGGNYGAQIIVPLMSVDIEIGALGVNDDQVGIGDIYVEPLLLSWHGPRWDAATSYGVYLPNGDFDAQEPASVGKGFLTHMISLGGTAYFDQQRMWHGSILARYEIHDEKDDVNITPGDDFHFEWGLGRTFKKNVDVGITGFSQWQVSDDKGSGVAGAAVKDTVHGIGPEVGWFIPRWELFLALRHIEEFGAEDRSEGSITSLTLTFTL
jgi:hypothetical protein